MTIAGSLADYEISWRNLNKILVFIVFIVNIICYCIFPATDLYNYSTLVINSFFCIILFISFSVNNFIILIFGSVASVISYIFIFPRVIINLVLPDLIPFPWYIIIGVINFNKGYLYLVNSVLVMLLGIWVVSLLIKKFSKFELALTKDLQKNKARYDVFITTCIFFLVVIIINLVFKFTIFNFDGEVKNNKILGILSFLFSASLAANCAIFNLKKESQSTRYSYFLIILIAILYILLSILLGSRSGPITLLYMIIGTKLLCDGDFKLSIKKYLLFLIGFIFISIISFKIGTDLRNDIMSDNPIYAQAQKIEAFQKAELIKKAEEANKKILKDNRNKNFNIKLDEGAEKLLIRLFHPFDLSILGVVLDRDNEYQKKYMNMQYMFKSAINNVVPGTIFVDANLNTALIWPFLFKIRDKEILNDLNYYETFAWGFWSVFNVMYGPYLGLFVIFIVGTLWGLMFYKILAIKDKEILASYFLFISFPFIFLAGIDDYISWSVQIFTSLILYLLISRYINFFIKKINI